MKSYLDYKGFEVLAHRGGSIESYENTVESFQYSVELGCKYIETDVQLSSDVQEASVFCMETEHT